MKKFGLLVFGLLALAVFAVTPSASAHGNNLPHETLNVTGVVTSAGNPVDHAKVTVYCNGHQKVDHTDASGTYSVTFHANKCPDGSTVNVVAEWEDKSGSASGSANSDPTVINIALVDVAGVPEFSTVAGLTALAGGAGFMVMNRRKQSALK